MRLNFLTEIDLIIGKLVVFIKEPNNQKYFGLRIIENITPVSISLEKIQLFDDEDDISDIISADSVNLYLRLPTFEIGDAIFMRGKKGKISQCFPNDLHVYVSLDEFPDKEFYTNLIHLDFTPAITQLLFIKN